MIEEGFDERPLVQALCGRIRVLEQRRLVEEVDGSSGYSLNPPLFTSTCATPGFQ
jgi:hypothetical protein